MKIRLFFILLIASGKFLAQFAGPPGSANTSAIHADSSAFVAWAKSCKITRGNQDISNTSLGYANVGDSTMALGKAGSNSIVSLGDAGYAILTFSAPIKNGAGFDFAVFENSFNDTYLELAFVEASSDGINYFRFPATSNSTTSPEFDNSAVMDATKLNNLAGKYRAMYGTPFDLQELSGNALLDINNVTHIKIIDVVGSINPAYARYDKNNNIINDPWPTPFGSSGFDLDAVGVIFQSVGMEENKKDLNLSIYPNPFTDIITIEYPGEIKLSLVNIIGKEIMRMNLQGPVQKVDLKILEPGVYFLSFENEKGNFIKKIVKQ